MVLRIYSLFQAIIERALTQRSVRLLCQNHIFKTNTKLWFQKYYHDYESDMNTFGDLCSLFSDPSASPELQSAQAVRAATLPRPGAPRLGWGPGAAASP